MEKTLLLLTCMVVSMTTAFDSSYLLGNRVTQYISNFQEKLGESFHEAYNGLNLIFKFDRDSHEEMVRFQYPEEKFLENVYAEGFDHPSQWYQFHNEQLKHKESRDLQDQHINEVGSYYEQHRRHHGNNSVEITLHQYQYFCNNTRVKFSDFLLLRKESKYKCENEPRKHSFSTCLNKYTEKVGDDGCIGLPELKCTFDILKPITDCYTLEEMNEYGLGEVCRVLDDNQNQTVEVLINCTQGIGAPGVTLSNSKFETVYDMEFKNGTEFWMKDKDRFLFIPFDPNFEVQLSLQNFKYFSQFQSYFAKITDQEQIIGKKSIKIDVDFRNISKAYSPGGRYFYKIWMLANQTASFTIDQNSGFLAKKNYEEPKKSPFDYYIQMITLKRVLFLLSLVCGISLCIFMKRRSKLREQKLLEQAD